MRITTNQSEPGFVGRCLRLPAALACLCLLWACPSVRSYDKGNGEDLVLHVDAPTDACRPRTDEREGSCSTGSCWMTRLGMQTHRLRVRRRFTVADCNGLGDCFSNLGWESVVDGSTPEITVEPAAAASVELLQDCGGDLMFALTPHVTGEFEVRVHIGDLKDSFILQTVDSCIEDEQICRVDVVPRCCCEPRYTTTACG